MTPDLDAYVQANFTVDNIDYLLYEAANLSLNRTIEMLGRDEFQVELKEHLRLQALAEHECMSHAHPCDGKSRGECYAGDS